MANYARIPSIDKNLSTASLGTTTSTAAIEVGSGKIIGITCTGTIQVAFGTASTMSAAAATDIVIPATAVATILDTGRFTYIRIYNPDGVTAVTYSVFSCRNS